MKITLIALIIVFLFTMNSCSQDTNIRDICGMDFMSDSSGSTHEFDILHTCYKLECDRNDEKNYYYFRLKNSNPPDTNWYFLGKRDKDTNFRCTNDKIKNWGIKNTNYIRCGSEGDINRLYKYDSTKYNLDYIDNVYKDITNKSWYYMM